MKHDDGGSAFPKDGQALRGMSLLDYFAGQALVGMLSARRQGEFDGYALDAYNIAAAMVAEKRRREG